MMGTKRRNFLIGGAVVLAGGAFGIKWADTAARKSALGFTAGKDAHNFSPWFKIADDDAITIYSPHADIGQGSNTGLAQMLADELDADWSKISVLPAPAEKGFANAFLGRGFLADMSGMPGMINAMPQALISFIARSLDLQITGGSSALRFTGQKLMQVIGASARLSLMETAAKRLGVPVAQLTTADSKVIHAASGKSLRYGELAAEASQLPMVSDPKLKDKSARKLIGKPVPRLDVPQKVDGTAMYGIDMTLPDMRVATIMAAPIRGGKLVSVDEKPALAVSGVEKVIRLENAVAVVGKGYWAAIQGLRALHPVFDDAGKNGDMSTASIFAAHDGLIKAGDPKSKAGDGDVDAALADTSAKIVEASYRVPFLHHAMMEPFVLTAHHKDGKLDIWGGLQDPLATKMAASKHSGLDSDNVTFHSMLNGGSFGRRLPMYVEVVEQVTKIAMQLPYPVKLIWSREEDVAQGAYRPQASAKLTAALGTNGKITGWRNDYAQPETIEGEATFIYDLPAVSRRLFAHKSNQTTGSWRSVNSTQHGFYNETFMDELAAAAGADPVEFRRKHLKQGSRHLAVLNEVAKRANWGSPLPEGVGRGVAIVESFKTIVAQVIEASVASDGAPKVHRVIAVVDCGTTVNPQNAENQVQGGIVMGLSAAIGEAITLEKGAVVQTSFTDYPILKMADAPPQIEVHFLNSGDTMGGLGEPGLPPAAPALANAIFAVTGKRIHALPIVAG